MPVRNCLFIAVIVTIWSFGGIARAQKGANGIPEHIQMKGPYPDGLSVTRDCITCHKKEAAQVLASAHWLWEGPSPYLEGHERDSNIGKKTLINGF